MCDVVAGGWRLVSVSVGLAALIIILVVVNMWIRIKGEEAEDILMRDVFCW